MLMSFAQLSSSFLPFVGHASLMFFFVLQSFVLFFQAHFFVLQVYFFILLVYFFILQSCLVVLPSGTASSQVYFFNSITSVECIS